METYEVIYFNVDTGCEEYGYFKTLEELTNWINTNQSWPYSHETIILGIHKVKDDEWSKTYGEKCNKLIEELKGLRC